MLMVLRGEEGALVLKPWLVVESKGGRGICDRECNHERDKEEDNK